jgi:hypothetical protein
MTGFDETLFIDLIRVLARLTSQGASMACNCDGATGTPKECYQSLESANSAGAVAVSRVLQERD